MLFDFLEEIHFRGHRSRGEELNEPPKLLELSEQAEELIRLVERLVNEHGQLQFLQLANCESWTEHAQWFD
jgi:hypothetical protein